MSEELTAEDKAGLYEAHLQLRGPKAFRFSGYDQQRILDLIDELLNRYDDKQGFHSAVLIRAIEGVINDGAAGYDPDLARQIVDDLVSRTADE